MRSTGNFVRASNEKAIIMLIFDVFFIAQGIANMTEHLAWVDEMLGKEAAVDLVERRCVPGGPQV